MSCMSVCAIAQLVHIHHILTSWKHHGKSVVISGRLGTSALLMLAENDTFPSVCAGESQAGNSIGSALF